MSRVTGRNTRPKKLTPKQNVPIFREEQVESASNLEDAIRNQVETGVEKSEESVSYTLSTHRGHCPQPPQDGALLTIAIGISSTTSHQSIAG